MATNVTSVGVTFDETDLGDLDGVVLDELVRGGPDEPSQARGRDDIALGKHGRVRRNRRKDVRTIEFRGYVFGTDTSDHWTNRVALGALLDTTTEGVLEIALKNGSAYTITALPMSVVYSFLAPSASRVSVVFESIDPDWVIGS